MSRRSTPGLQTLVSGLTNTQVPSLLEQVNEVLSEDLSLFNAEEAYVNVSASLRKDEDYGSGTDFLMFEFRWQQYARQAGQDKRFFTRKPVRFYRNNNELDTFSYPGSLWDSKDAYVRIDLSATNETLFDLEEGVTRALAPESNPAIATKTQLKKPSEAWIVNSRPPTV